METRDEKHLQRLERIALLLDARFRIPVIGVRFGLDSIIGLVPFGGDLIAFLVSAVLVLHMLRYGVGWRIALQMCFNILLDFLVGTVPVLGDVFDFTFPANVRNVRLLKRHFDHEEGRVNRVFTWILAFVLGIIFLVAAYLLWVIVTALI